MPSYKVIAPGFANGKMYKPNGKRSVFHTDKPFNKSNPMPSWLSEMPAETPKQRKIREAAEASQNNTDADKAAADKKDIEDASFLGTGEAGSVVETI